MSDQAINFEMMQEMKKIRAENELANEVTRYRTRHLLHLVLSIISAGCWSFVWTIVSCMNCSKRNTAWKLAGKKGETNWAGIFLSIQFVIVSFLFFVIMTMPPVHH